MTHLGIKLFGRRIQLREAVSVESGTGDDRNRCFRRNPQTRELQEVGLKGVSLARPLMVDPLSGNTNVEAYKAEQQQEVGVSSQEKGLKKPERILPCPRCNSADTKFCYYNNYNTNQPRHFCKKCQRYWTAGGTMRNVPVGAGRRKNKSSVDPFRHVAAPEVPQKVQVENPIRLGDKKSLSNGFSRTGEQESYVSHGSKEFGHDHSVESSVANPKAVIGKRTLPSQVPCCPGAPWPYPCSSDQWSSLASAPKFGYASFPLPSYTTAAPPVVGCTVPSIWMGPWIVPRETMPPCSGTSSPALGKHSRDDRNLKSANMGEETLKENTSEQILWVPKTSRIEVPTKNSILSNLGIKEDNVDLVGFFKASKGHFKNKGTLDMNPSTVLQANPAALSRALNFHESS